MRVLITGGSGALGTEVCAGLRASGHDPAVFDLAAPPRSEQEWFRGDIADGLALAEAMQAGAIQAVVHLASLLTFETAANPRRAVLVNSVGMANALEATRIFGLRRFVYASTVGVFSGSSGPEVIPNDAPYRPIDVYGGTKILNETLADHYRRRFELEAIGLRFPLMMGAIGADQPTSLVGLLGRELIEKPVRGLPSSLPYADDVPNWLWIGDAAQAIVTAVLADSAVPGDYNVGGDIRPMHDAVRIVSELLPDAQITTEPGKFGLELRLDPTVFEKRFGFRPQWQLEDQLRELIRRARDRHLARTER